MVHIEFPVPNKVHIPGLNGGDFDFERAKRVIIAKLLEGKDCQEQVIHHRAAGGNTSQLLFAALGDRDKGIKPSVKMVNTLVLLDADQNANHRVHGPAVTHASRNATPDIVELLLKSQADPNALDPEGRPPLYSAIFSGRAKNALMLLKHGADAAWSGEDGMSHLHVLTTWLTDYEEAHLKRVPPSGDEPRQLMVALLRGGADPTSVLRPNFTAYTI